VLLALDGRIPPPLPPLLNAEPGRGDTRLSNAAEAAAKALPTLLPVVGRSASSDAAVIGRRGSSSSLASPSLPSPAASASPSFPSPSVRA
jgi:hypothetical protein